MSNSFWSQELPASIWPADKHMRKHLSISRLVVTVARWAVWLLKRFALFQKSCFIASSSKKRLAVRKCNVLFAGNWETGWYYCLCPSGRICHKAFSPEQSGAFPHFMHAGPFVVCWLTLSRLQSNLSPRPGPLLLAHHNAKQLTTSFIKMNSVANSIATI